jgi:hypothetical protein
MSLSDGSALRPDGPRSGLSAVVTRTVRARAESVRVPSFSRDLLPKTAGLTRETVGNGSRPPLYIDEGLRPIKPPTIELLSTKLSARTVRACGPDGPRVRRTD